MVWANGYVPSAHSVQYALSAAEAARSSVPGKSVLLIDVVFYALWALWVEALRYHLDQSHEVLVEDMSCGRWASETESVWGYCSY